MERGRARRVGLGSVECGVAGGGGVAWRAAWREPGGVARVVGGVGWRALRATASHFFSKNARHFFASSCAIDPAGLYRIALEKVRCTASAISSAPW